MEFDDQLDRQTVRSDGDRVVSQESIPRVGKYTAIVGCKIDDPMTGTSKSIVSALEIIPESG